MISPELLAMLVCPENRQSLEIADAQMLAAINRAIATGTVRNRAGEAVTEPLEGCLVRADRALAYPIEDGIPIMLVDAGIPLDRVVSERVS